MPPRDIKPDKQITDSRDDERGGIDQVEIKRLARKCILLEE